MNFRKNLSFLILLIFLFDFPLFQEYLNSNNLLLPKNNLINLLADNKKQVNGKSKNLSLSFNFDYVFNNGHSNIDNHSEFYSPSKKTEMMSTKLFYSNSWLIIEIEPYKINRSKYFPAAKLTGPFQVSNNHTNFLPYHKNVVGFKQSRLFLKFRNLALGYGNMSHWWGPGFHSSISLSTNAPSQKTFFFGTLKDFKREKFSFGSNLIVMPYRNTSDSEIFFSALRSTFTIHSSNVITTFGINRTYLSGNFLNLSQGTINQKNWSIYDAAKLVLEPLFGQSKKNLPYTIPGTQGFDIWDELLTGYVKIKFTDINLEIYADVASDDNRANLTDFRAHWDHTMGYQLGFKKITNFNSLIFFSGAELLSTKVSNTFNPSFFRGSANAPNFYTKIPYDYFSYQGRRMGAHSGTSSDDLIFLVGLRKENRNLFISYNFERHGIKSMTYPEIKKEISLLLQFEHENGQRVSIAFENEKINNFGFEKNKLSISNFIWFSYSFNINKVY